MATEFDYVNFAHDVKEMTEGFSHKELAQLAENGIQVWTKIFNLHPIGMENFIKVCNLLSLDPHNYIRER